MDLDDMKHTWSELTDELSQREALTDAQILQMTKRKSSSRLNRLIYMEVIGSIVSVIMLVYLVLNFNRLDNWLTLTGGYFFLLMMLTGFIMSYHIITKIRKVNVLDNSYQQTVVDFQSLKKTLGVYKRFSIVLNVIAPFLIIPVTLQLLFDQDILQDLNKFWEGLAASFIILPILLSLLIYYYRSNVRQAAKALQEYEHQKNNGNSGES